jgi:uncharacterized protein YlxP (DUF503 family)
MVIGYGSIVLGLPETHSLKEKRRVVKAVIARIRNNFNASAAEVGENDSLGRAEIGFALVGNSRRLINSKMDLLLNMVEDMGIAPILDSEMEMVNL